MTGIFYFEHIHPVIETFAALAEPNRFRIVELLRSGARSVNEIGERLALNQPQVSKHLRVLKEAGLVGVEPRAQQRVYDLRPQPLRAMHDWLDRYRQLWDQRFEALDRLLVEMQAEDHEMQKKKEKEARHERRKRHRK